MTPLGVVSLALFLCTRAWAYPCGVDCDGGDPTDCWCVPGSGVCEITTLQDVDPGAIIDCSGVDVHLKGSFGRIEVTDGFVTLRADDLTINSDRHITAFRNTAGVPFGIRIELTGKLDMSGYLNVNDNDGGGSVVVKAGGDILVQNVFGGDGIKANGTSSGKPGGTIDLTAGGDVLIGDPLVARSSTDGSANGGDIEITAGDDILVNDTIDTFGRRSQAGTIRLTAGAHIDVTSAINAEGGGTDGNGGEIHFVGQQVTIGAAISAQGGINEGGALSEGGQVMMDVGADGVAINASINVTGGEAGSGLNGGAIVVESEGPITIANGVSLLTKSDANGGNGGDILLESEDALTINDVTIDARGHAGGSNQGSGAVVRMQACALSVGTGASIDASGYDGGSILMIARESLSISASSAIAATAAGGESGVIELRYRIKGACSTNPQIACEVGKCVANPSRCSNDPGKICTSSADCTSGCGSGQCVASPNSCTNTGQTCTSDSACTGCASGTCVGSSTGGTTAQFNPSPELIRNRNIEACD